MMCCYIKDTDSIVFLYCTKIIQYTIKYESSTNHYKLVNYEVPAHNMCNSLTHVVCLYLPHTSCTVIFILYILYKLPRLVAIDTFL